MLPWLNEPLGVRVAVIGDIILDEYLEGRVERISPEAPVPINLVKQTIVAAGGAANSALNIRLVGGQAALFGVWGVDATAASLADILRRHEIASAGVVCAPDRPTPRKTRVTSGHQQMLRIDWEQTQAITKEQEQQVIAALQQESMQGILVSDYGKGLLQEELLQAIFVLAAQKSIPCVVDPKGRDFTKYRGCSLITPNYAEACLALGISVEAGYTGEHLGALLQERYGLHDVLVTMGAQGMVYLSRDKEKTAIFRRPRAREVFDVSGAGDTVAALMALSLAAQVAPEEAVDLANLGAGIVVEKRGTQPVLRRELETRLAETHLDLYTRYFGTARPQSINHPKILDCESLAAVMRSGQQAGKTFVFTNGCFDLLHAGHVDLLEQAKAFGNFLVVALNSDDSVQRLNKGPGRPIVSLADRQRVIAALGCVDYVVEFSEDTPALLVDALQPDVLVKGGDYRLETIVGAETVLKRGGRVEIVPLLPERSTSALIATIQTMKVSEG